MYKLRDKKDKLLGYARIPEISLPGTSIKRPFIAPDVIKMPLVS
jgi:hypothetical protein